ncbi:hypothetical protein EVA_06129 [gut metagenome]|uniref:Uncharacterized protein n=1 Tax=gut metagenome TaxID=749906 RepID=J9GEJ6_9ZZZZ
MLFRLQTELSLFQSCYLFFKLHKVDTHIFKLFVIRHGFPMFLNFHQ